jgi:hypothetical protein
LRDTHHKKQKTRKQRRLINTECVLYYIKNVSSYTNAPIPTPAGHKTTNLSPHHPFPPHHTHTHTYTHTHTHTYTPTHLHTYTPTHTPTHQHTHTHTPHKHTLTHLHTHTHTNREREREREKDATHPLPSGPHLVPRLKRCLPTLLLPTIVGPASYLITGC